MVVIILFAFLIGLNRTSRPVRKSGKFSKSGMSGNRTFSCSDAGLLTLLKIDFFFNFLDFFLSIFKSVKSPASGKENVRFLDSPDFENLPDFRTGRDVR